MGIYIAIVVFLMCLAVYDLSVGVSNDAVNFLNSAVGAKVAKLSTILIVAAVGVFVGASTSNGMMDIARHGIFMPSYYSFKELIFLFVAVMICDILLLNLFNNLGMPTSTTVSLVFEMVGATACLTMLKIIRDPSLTVGQLINTDKALSVIVSIFVSVGIAFVVGLIIQYICRLLFSFMYKTDKSLKWKIGIFGGIAASLILYFMVIKGFGKSTIMSKEAMAWIKANTGGLLLASFVVCTILTQILHALKVDVFKILVLMGTFALAMSFAGNDLVNFIGIPLAGFSAFQDFAANGGGLEHANDFMMHSLNASAKTPVYFLIGAGAIMVVCLSTSKKALGVLRTSVNLSSQSQGEEMFGSSKIARSIVRGCSNAAQWCSAFVPEKTKAWIETRFDNSRVPNEKNAAFDELRAVVNLVVASLIISFGTSLKLPLSTTYVTFMVAMGTSLADRAWGRESAVFRVTGVLTVIGGWFLTAAIAFTLCFIVTLVMDFGGMPMLVVVIAFGVFVLIRSNISYRKRAAKEHDDPIYEALIATTDKDEAKKLLAQHIYTSEAEFLGYANDTYADLTNGFINEELVLLNKANKSIRKERVVLKNTRRKEIVGLRQVDPTLAIEKNTWFHLGRNSCEDILYCMRRICDACHEHIDNNFTPLSKDKVKEFVPLRDTVLFAIRRTQDLVSNGQYDEYETMCKLYDQAEDSLSKARKAQMDRMQAPEENLTLSYVYLNMLQESQEIVTSLRHLFRAAEHFQK